MVYLKSVENVITLGKWIGLLFLFCFPLLSILFLKTERNDLARPVMGTIFLVIWCTYDSNQIEAHEALTSVAWISPSVVSYKDTYGLLNH